MFSCAMSVSLCAIDLRQPAASLFSPNCLGKDPKAVGRSRQAPSCRGSALRWLEMAEPLRPYGSTEVRLGQSYGQEQGMETPERHLKGSGEEQKKLCRELRQQRREGRVDEQTSLGSFFPRPHREVNGTRLWRCGQTGLLKEVLQTMEELREAGTVRHQPACVLEMRSCSIRFRSSNIFIRFCKLSCKMILLYVGLVLICISYLYT